MILVFKITQCQDYSIYQRYLLKEISTRYNQVWQWLWACLGLDPIEELGT